MRLTINQGGKRTSSCLSVSSDQAQLNDGPSHVFVPGSSVRWALLSLTVLCMLILPGSAQGQGFGKIVGNVTDPSGAVIVDAKVTVIQVGRGLTRTATTDSSGHYTLDSLRPSEYEMTVEASGFNTYGQKSVTLLADQTLTANVSLQVGPVSESVSVTSGTEIDTTTSTLKQVIEERTIQELPLNGRNAAELSLLVAGTVSYPTNPANPTGTFAGGALQGATKTFPGAVAIVTNGSRQNQVSYQLDGGNNVDEYTNVKHVMFDATATARKDWHRTIFSGRTPTA